jgi:hypothetical protein
MNNICIPLGPIAGENRAEVEVKIPVTGEVWRYRIETVPGHEGTGDVSMKTDEVELLQQYISSYNKDWELIQIFSKNERTGNIHVLYREKRQLTT